MELAMLIGLLAQAVFDSGVIGQGPIVCIVLHRIDVVQALIVLAEFVITNPTVLLSISFRMLCGDPGMEYVKDICRSLGCAIGNNYHVSPVVLKRHCVCVQALLWIEFFETADKRFVVKVLGQLSE